MNPPSPSRTTRWRRRVSACAETFWQEVVRRKGDPCLPASQIAALSLLRPWVWVKRKGSRKPSGHSVSLSQAGRMASHFEMEELRRFQNPLYKTTKEQDGE